MKFRFTAIDGNGRVLRGVLRAESEADVREIMVAEEVYPKQLEPVGEDEKATWAPRQRIRERAAGAAEARRTAEQRPVSAVFETRLLAGGARGTAGLSDDGAFVFQATGGEKLVLSATQLEDVRVLGFPARVLRLTELSGRMHEFAAGFLLANGAARMVARHFQNSPRKAGK